MKTFFEEWVTDTGFVVSAILLTAAVIGLVAWQILRRRNRAK